MAYRANDFEERFYDDRRYNDVRVADRQSDRQSDRLDFIRNDPRPPEAGPLVLRQRDVESREISRPRYRSPSPVRHEHMGMVRRARSETPPHVHDERERDRIRIANRERVRYEREPSPLPPPVRYERRRSSSGSRERERERERIRIIQRERERERIPERAPSPRPPSPPPVIRGPTIEREVITHYRGIDHGVTRVPSPPPPPRPAPPPRVPAMTRTEERQLEIDIETSRRGTNVGIRDSHRRERSMERRSPHMHGHGSELVLSSDRDRLRVDDRHWHSHSGGSRRRAHSAAPLRSPVDEEAEYITSRIESRGRMGEAWNGATKDWSIVDVPPGTERVRMDGVGGGAAEVTWQRYNGVRRAKFIPERDGAMVPAPAPKPAPTPRESRSSGFERELEIEISRDRRRGSSRAPAPPPQRKDEMWTELTKDLVCREALMDCGYEFEETEYFFYVMQYLKYDNVLELIQITESYHRRRHERDSRRQWEREYRDSGRYDRPRSKYGERISEREIVYDNTRMRRV